MSYTSASIVYMGLYQERISAVYMLHCCVGHRTTGGEQTSCFWLPHPAQSTEFFRGQVVDRSIDGIGGFPFAEEEVDNGSGFNNQSYFHQRPSLNLAIYTRISNL